MDSKTCPRCGGLKKVVANDLKTVSECPMCGGAGFILGCNVGEFHTERSVESVAAAEIAAIVEKAEFLKVLDKGLSNDKKVEKRKKGKAGQQG